MSSLKLYIVENDGDDREIFREVLADLSCETHLFTCGTAMLEHLAREGGQFDFGVFIFDMNMSSPNGIELTRRLRSARNVGTCPVIVFSTSSDPGDIAASYEAGATAFLTKPGLFGEWQALLTALVEFWQWTCPDVRSGR